MGDIVWCAQHECECAVDYCAAEWLAVLHYDIMTDPCLYNNLYVLDGPSLAIPAVNQYSCQFVITLVLSTLSQH